MFRVIVLVAACPLSRTDNHDESSVLGTSPVPLEDLFPSFSVNFAPIPLSTHTVVTLTDESSDWRLPSQLPGQGPPWKALHLKCLRNKVPKLKTPKTQNSKNPKPNNPKLQKPYTQNPKPKSGGLNPKRLLSTCMGGDLLHKSL